MSDNDAKSFLDKVKSDPAVRDALVGAISDGASKGAVEAGKKLGLDFSTSELIAAYADEMRASGLTEGKLKDLSSGGTPILYGAAPDGAYAAHPAYASHEGYADHPGYGDTAESSKYAGGPSEYGQNPS